MTVLHLIKLLVNNEYELIERLTKSIRLEAIDIKEAIDSYGRTVIMIPESEYENLIDIIEISNSIPKRWSVRFDLWTKEEGRSDLSLEMTLIDSDKEFMDIELDDIHVL